MNINNMKKMLFFLHGGAIGSLMQYRAVDG